MPAISAQEVMSVREQLHLSRPVFTRYLRTNPRTLENWEQGRAKPNTQAALLIRMVAQYPDRCSCESGQNFRLICLFICIKLASRPHRICVNSYISSSKMLEATTLNSSWIT